MTGAVSGAVTVAFNESQMFSQEQLLDCFSEQGSPTEDQGCNGGFMDKTIQALKKDGTPCVTEEAYPYEQIECTAPSTNTYVCPVPGNEDGTCLKKSEEGAVVVKDYEEVEWDTVDNADAIKEALMTYGALSIAVDANTFQTYSSGVLDCSEENLELDHGVVLTGFGVDAQGTSYWEVKNSWSSGWGEDGYIRVKIGSNEGDNRADCGISSEPIAVTKVIKV